MAISFFVLNGYGIFEDNNKKKSLGVVATYVLGETGNIGYSNYVGDDTPIAGDSVSHTRVFQNLFLNYQIKKLKIQIGADYILQQNSNIAVKTMTASMYSGVLGFKYQLKEKFAFYARGEIFNDPQGFMSGVIIDNTNKYTGLELWGVTLGAEYKPTENSYVRLESRNLEMDPAQEIFRFDGENEDNRLEILCNIGVSF